MMMEVPQYVEVAIEYDLPVVSEFALDYERGVLKKNDCVEVTYEDAQCLMKIAQAEAGNQGVDGMALVMQTVLNRVEDDDFPNTVYEVISQKGQFQSYANGTYVKAIPCVDCHLALAEVEMGMFSDDTVIAFEVAGTRSLDKYFMYAFTLGDHDFYTEK